MSQSVLREPVEKAPPNTSPPSSPKHSKKRRITLRRVHKWLGITAALWLTVLGVTGFFLDHRDWRFMWQVTVPDVLFPESILKNKVAKEIVVYRINPGNAKQRIAAGKRGAWWSEDAGATWNPSVFESPGHQTPQVLSVVEELSDTWWYLYAATDDGVWRSSNGGVSFYRFALRGEYVNALTYGSHSNEFLGVVSRSSLFRLNINTGKHNKIEITPVNENELPKEFGLSRFVHDLHFGRGVVNGITSLLINDAGSVAMVILPLTGILFWWLPLRWKKRRANSRPEHVSQRKAMRFLYGWHGVYIGIFSAIIIVYLAITGIILDHRADLGEWMKAISIDRKWLPPVYNLRSWNDEVYSVAGYPEKLSVGTRGGLYTTEDNGQTWNREKLPGPSACFVWSLNRVGDFLFAGGMGCPNSFKKDGGLWNPVQNIGHMPTDASRLPGGGFAWKSPKGFMAVSLSGTATKLNIREPKVTGTPLFYLLDGLHSGLIFHPQWKWINDLVSVMAIVLCISGVYRLWRQRRIVVKCFIGIEKIVEFKR